MGSLFASFVRIESIPDYSVMIAQCPRICVVSEPAQECRRALYISEQKGKRLDEGMLRDWLTDSYRSRGARFDARGQRDNPDLRLKQRTIARLPFRRVLRTTRSFRERPELP